MVHLYFCWDLLIDNEFSSVHLSAGSSVEPTLNSGVKSLWLVDCFQKVKRGTQSLIREVRTPWILWRKGFVIKAEAREASSWKMGLEDQRKVTSLPALRLACEQFGTWQGNLPGKPAASSRQHRTVKARWWKVWSLCNDCLGRAKILVGALWCWESAVLAAGKSWTPQEGAPVSRKLSALPCLSPLEANAYCFRPAFQTLHKFLFWPTLSQNHTRILGSIVPGKPSWHSTHPYKQPKKKKGGIVVCTFQEKL